MHYSLSSLYHTRSLNNTILFPNQPLVLSPDCFFSTTPCPAWTPTVFTTAPRHILGLMGGRQMSIHASMMSIFLVAYTKNNPTRTIIILVGFDILHKLAGLLVKQSLYLLLIAACVSLITRGQSLFRFKCLSRCLRQKEHTLVMFL